MRKKTSIVRGLIFFALAELSIYSPSAFPSASNRLCPHYEAPAAAVMISGEKHVLANGLTVIVDRDDSSKTTVIEILIRGGQKADPAGKEGLSWLATRLSLEIAEEGKVLELMELSSLYFTESAGDFSTIRITCLSAHLDKTLAILTASLRDPILSGLRIDAWKERMVHFSKRERDDSVRLGHHEALSAFFGGAGCGAPPYGTEDSIKAITKKDLVNYHKTRFTAGNMVVAVSSDLDEKNLLDILKKHFSRIARGEPAASPSAALAVPGDRNRIIDKETKQVFISRAFVLPQLTPKNYALIFLLENLLGKGPASRLWPLRSEEKLAYNVTALATLIEDGGVLEAYLETAREKSDAGRRSLLAVLEGVHREGVSEEEFAPLKTAARAEFLRSNESKNARSAHLAAFEVWGFGPEFLSGFFDVLDGISRDDLNAFIRQVLDPANSVEIVIGRAAGTAPQSVGKSD